MTGFFSKLRQTSASPSGPVEWLIAGLGNPGREYETTRHNAGFRALDALADSCGARVDRLKFKSLCGEAQLGGKRVLLLKPQTFMNNSGEALRDAAAFYKIPPERMLVLYDDISLQPGRLRIRLKGSDGGHNGIKSIIYLTGKDTFPRIKIGVGAKPDPRWDLADWVLSSCKGDDAAALEAALKKVPEVCALLVEGKSAEAMNRFNS
ncbi:MAG: aminoacyl-tRNA hydrolase [Firmicutes bacterium]|nr:aminoacyl-tRNA hydrolase [Bacillota bacterium]